MRSPGSKDDIPNTLPTLMHLRCLWRLHVCLSELPAFFVSIASDIARMTLHTRPDLKCLCRYKQLAVMGLSMVWGTSHNQMFFVCVYVFAVLQSIPLLHRQLLCLHCRYVHSALRSELRPASSMQCVRELSVDLEHW